MPVPHKHTYCQAAQSEHPGQSLSKSVSELTRREKSTKVQIHVYAMPFGTQPIVKPLDKLIRSTNNSFSKNSFSSIFI